MYDPTKLNTRQLPTEGQRTQATVVTIRDGKISDFVKPEAMAKWKNATPASPAIEVTAITNDGFTIKRAIQNPADGLVHPKSTLGKWKHIYGAYPHDQQKIDVVADSQGYYQFLV